MIRILAAGILVLGLLSLTSCMDPEPAEISVIATMDGQPQNARVQVFNSSGKQIQEVYLDRGIQYIKQLLPGKYTLKFLDNQGNFYPAIREVNIDAGDSVPVEVDLNDTSGNPAEGE